ncbi:mitogen-activated protein kinase kinase kinase 20-like [Mangifera indica]|uniref:mitogen-activated protein kinase kinase kinase 20-like n=1 Tax=Mangifera indica TaxID=29780 RepID=UPI001CF99B8C|nr:mitogen-activated protein kinase kinase kinase 20-like [Mangifera indica]
MELPAMDWVRGDVIGHGNFGSVSLAVTRKNCSRFPSLMAVKTCQDSCSSSLKNEKEVLDELGCCPQIVGCFGGGYSVENGERFYNLFLEYASRGSLADWLRKNNGKLQESDVKRYTRSVLKGLRHIHAKGFVHCDIKLQNLLVFDQDEAKIADFGLAKKSGTENKQEKFECRGTPLFMSPEAVNDNEYEPPGDIWALGCAVVEMITGKPAWNFKDGGNVFGLLIRIGVGDELPVIPGELSEEGKDFLVKCFVKDPKQRWTADMLLNHPFVSVDSSFDDHGDEIFTLKEEEIEESPRSPFDFPGWISVQSSIRTSGDSSFVSSRNCFLDRIRQLAGDERPSWADSESWVTVR